MFSWLPIHTEVATRLLEFETRQSDLIALLADMECLKWVRLRKVMSGVASFVSPVAGATSVQITPSRKLSLYRATGREAMMRLLAQN